MTDAGSSVPCRRGLCGGCQRDPRGAGSCRQDGGLGVPRWCPAPRSAGRRYRLPRQKINASPPCLFPTRPSHHLCGRWGGVRGGGTRWCGDAGARHLLLVPAEGEEDGGSSLIPLIPFLCLPVGGPAPSKRGNGFLKTTAICESNQAESLKLLEIPFFLSFFFF